MDFEYSEWNVDTTAVTLTQQLFDTPQWMTKRSMKRKHAAGQICTGEDTKQDNNSMVKKLKREQIKHQKPDMEKNVTFSKDQNSKKFNEVAHGKKTNEGPHNRNVKLKQVIVDVSKHEQHESFIQEKMTTISKEMDDKKHHRDDIVGTKANMKNDNIDSNKKRNMKKRVLECKRNKLKNSSQPALCKSDLACDSKVLYSAAGFSMQYSSDHSDIEVNDEVHQQTNSSQNNSAQSKVAASPFDPEILSAMLSMKTMQSENQLSNKKNKMHHGETTAVKYIKTGKNIPVHKEKDPQKSFLEKSRERLNAARFRYLNEMLYSKSGEEALLMFRKDRAAFQVYHAGFQGQVQKWPSNPVQHIISDLQRMPHHFVITDFGCGDATIARSVPNQVHSFDLVSLNKHVTACDMSKVPLRESCVDVAVFCLSLMGTNMADYIYEANRVLRQGGMLKIAEVASRLVSVGQFVLQVEKMGFKVTKQDCDNKMFVLMDFRKTRSTKKGQSTSDLKLLPCVYKKR